MPAFYALYLRRKLPDDRPAAPRVQALPWTAFELQNALHPEDLPPIRRTVVRIAAAQMGVGGDDSWGAPVAERYRLPAAEPRRLRFTLTTAGA